MKLSAALLPMSRYPSVCVSSDEVRAVAEVAWMSRSAVMRLQVGKDATLDQQVLFVHPGQQPGHRVGGGVVVVSDERYRYNHISSK
jgi:hypothetical protein